MPGTHAATWDRVGIFCLSDERCLMLIIKKKLKKINLSLCFLPKIVFFWGFENDIIFIQKVQYLFNEGSDLYIIQNLST